MERKAVRVMAAPFTVIVPVTVPSGSCIASVSSSVLFPAPVRATFWSITIPSPPATCTICTPGDATSTGEECCKAFRDKLPCGTLCCPLYK